VRLYIDKR